MTSGKAVVLAASVALAAFTVQALAQGTGQFPEDQVKNGSAIYARNCSPCHAPHMLDLRNFPPGEKSRFVTSVVKGKNQMPPFGGLYNADEIEALWAYVIAGEK